MRGRKGGVGLPERMFEAIVVEMVQLVVHDSNQPAYRHVMFRQGFSAMLRLAHGVQDGEDVESELGDLSCVVGLFAVGEDRFLEQQRGQTLDDVFLVGPLVRVAQDDGSKGVGEDTGAEDVEHDLDLLERLAGFEHDEDKVPAHEAPEVFDVVVAGRAGTGNEIEDVEAFFDVDARLQFRGCFALKALEAGNGVDVGRYLGQGDQFVGDERCCLGYVLYEDELYEV